VVALTVPLAINKRNYMRAGPQELANGGFVEPYFFAQFSVERVVVLLVGFNAAAREHPHRTRRELQ
jgi:hypothetical protein